MSLVPAQELFLIRLDDAAERAVGLARPLAELAHRGAGRHPLVNEVCGKHRTGPAAARVTMDEHLLSLADLRIHERHELIDLIEGRSREIFHADFLVLEARVLDFERVQAVTFEAHDDGVPHLTQAGKVPLHERRARKASEATSVNRVVEHLHGTSPSRRSNSK